MDRNQSLVFVPTVDASARERNALAAVVLALMAAFYAGLSIFYFYEDFFKYIEPGFSAYMSDRSGVSVHVSGYTWTVLSPFRILLALATVFLLGFAAVSLVRRYRFGRPLALFTLWGVLLPQLFWYTEFSVDWYGGAGLTAIVAIAFLIAALPTALLYDGRGTLTAWSGRCAAPGRVLGAAVFLGWLGFMATECLDHSYQMTSDLAYAGALLAVGLSVLGAYGLLRFRAWALPVAAGAVASFALVPFAFETAAYRASGGYIDAAVNATTATPCAVLFTALVPMVLLYLTAGPYLREFARRLTSNR